MDTDITRVPVLISVHSVPVPVPVHSVRTRTGTRVRTRVYVHVYVHIIYTGTRVWHSMYRYVCIIAIHVCTHVYYSSTTRVLQWIGFAGRSPGNPLAGGVPIQCTQHPTSSSTTCSMPGKPARKHLGVVHRHSIHVTGLHNQYVEFPTLGEYFHAHRTGLPVLVHVYSTLVNTMQYDCLLIRLCEGLFEEIFLRNTQNRTDTFQNTTPRIGCPFHQIDKCFANEMKWRLLQTIVWHRTVTKCP